MVPLEGHPRVRAYYNRLAQRPSFLRALKDAEPFNKGVPFASAYAVEFNRLMGN